MRDHSDNHFMRIAYEQAQFGEQQGEVPIGAVVVKDDIVIGKGWNSPISKKDPSAHAEVIALRDAAHQLNNYRLVNTTLYVTLEPCMMCACAMVHARIQRLVFGAYDLKAGAAGSCIDVFELPFVNHRIEVVGGVIEEDCRLLLKNFFISKR